MRNMRNMSNKRSPDTVPEQAAASPKADEYERLLAEEDVRDALESIRARAKDPPAKVAEIALTELKRWIAWGRFEESTNDFNDTGSLPLRENVNKDLEAGFLWVLITRYFPDRWMVAMPEGDEPGLVLVVNDVGVWERPEQGVGLAHVALVLEWYLQALHWWAHSKIVDKESQKAWRSAYQSASNKLHGWHKKLPWVEAGARRAARDESAELFRVCELADLDAQRGMIGTNRGVLDLTRQDSNGMPVLLTPKEGATRLVTYRMSDAYNPEIEPLDKSVILTAMPADEADCLLDCLAFALFARPSRRLYCILGPTGSGKSTLLAAMRGLGPYLSRVNPDMFVQLKHRDPNSPNPSIRMMTQPVALAVCSEVADVPLDTESVKRLTGGDEIVSRLPYQKMPVPLKPTATPVLLANEFPGLSTTDAALLARLTTFYMPPPARENVKLHRRFEEQVTHRQAFLNDLLKRAVRMWADDQGKPPEIVASVKARSRELILAQQHPVQQWIAEYIKDVRKTQPESILFFADVWTALVRVAKTSDNEELQWSGGRVSGYSKNRLSRAIKAYFGAKLDSGTYRTDDGVGRGFKGLKLLQD